MPLSFLHPTMPLSLPQKSAIEEVIQAIMTTYGHRKRNLSAMFLELPDREDYPEYYEVVPEPRCIDQVRDAIRNDRVNDPLEAFNDLALVFWNALFYNEPTSGIAADAMKLKNVLEGEWLKRGTILPLPRSTSPPLNSGQKIRGELVIAAPRSTPVPAPAHIPAPQPVASGSMSRPVAIRPKSQPRGGSMDVDGDVGTPEPDTGSPNDNVTHDPQTEELVRKTESELAVWPGFGPNGWMKEVPAQRVLDIIHALKTQKDAAGNRIAAAVDAVPDVSDSLKVSYKFPLSMQIIEARALSGGYSNSQEFDHQMAQLFEKARKHCDPGSEQYTNVLHLQRMYQALTSDSPPVGPPYVSTTNWASIRAGPGNPRSINGDSEGPAVTTFRVSNKDRTWKDEVHYKGWTLRLGDWVHLSNPDDPGRPIIAQVFKVWQLDDHQAKPGQLGMTVCWYYRPEQTYHPAHRSFWGSEVFKTGHFADHPCEDLIERIACQFTARHIRGRPKPPSWYVAWPLYVCDSRYNDKERLFVRIKNWNSCVPEEVRKREDFMPIVEFEQSLFPRLYTSPFLGNGSLGTGALTGPGGISDPVERAPGEKGEGGGTGRKRTKRTLDATDWAGPSRGVHVSAPPIAPPRPGQYQLPQPQYQPAQYQPPPPPVAPVRTLVDRSVVGSAGALGPGPQMEKLGKDIAKFFQRDPNTDEVLWFGAQPMNVAQPAVPQHTIAYLHFLTKKEKKDKEAEALRDGAEGPVPKKTRTQPPTANETVNALLEEFDSRSHSS